LLTQDVKPKEKTKKKTSVETKSDVNMEGRLENLTLEDVKMEDPKTANDTADKKTMRLKLRVLR
jgi:hypothetical protein